MSDGSGADCTATAGASVGGCSNCATIAVDCTARGTGVRLGATKIARSARCASATQRKAGMRRERNMPTNAAGATPATAGDEACILARMACDGAGRSSDWMPPHKRQMNNEIHRVATKPISKTISGS